MVKEESRSTFQEDWACYQSNRDRLLKEYGGRVFQFSTLGEYRPRTRVIPNGAKRPACRSIGAGRSEESKCRLTRTGIEAVQPITRPRSARALTPRSARGDNWMTLSMAASSCHNRRDSGRLRRWIWSHGQTGLHHTRLQGHRDDACGRGAPRSKRTFAPRCRDVESGPCFLMTQDIIRRPGSRSFSARAGPENRGGPL